MKNPGIFIDLISIFYSAFDEIKLNQKTLMEYINLNFETQLDFENLKQSIEKNNSYRQIGKNTDTILSEIEVYCKTLNLSISERVYNFFYIIDYLFISSNLTNELYRVLETLGSRFFVEQDIFSHVFEFITAKNPDDLNRKPYLIIKSASESDSDLEGSWIEDNIPQEEKLTRNIELAGFNGTIVTMYLPATRNFYLRIFNTKISIPKFVQLEPGGLVYIDNNSNIQYQWLKKYYLRNQNISRINILAENVSYQYANSDKGIKSFSFFEESGQLIGIIGKEGVGKSTLLELFSGTLKSTTGNIFINGYNLASSSYLLKNIIGYVSEKDLLFDEHTVYENLYLSSKLYLGKLSKAEKQQHIQTILYDLDIADIKEVKVGKISDKNLQPGQRRLVNIAVELLRNPEILLIDNAIEGLNMADASKIIRALYHLTFKGKLIITSISQTSEEAFKLFDKIFIIDDGGYPIYYGNTAEALDYFQSKIFPQNLRKQSSQIPQKINAEEIIDAINIKSIQTGDINITERRKSPEEWYKEYNKVSSIPKKTPQQRVLPTGIYQLPSLDKQFAVYNIRNFKTKYTNYKRLLITFSAGPIIASIIAGICRFLMGTGYSFSENSNLPLYIFLSTLVMLFFGLYVSANEIWKERDILHKEEYLNYSRFSYINSKIIFLFSIAAIHSLLYTLAGNFVLEIKQTFFQFWIANFSIEAFGVILGLVFSSTVRKIETIFSFFIPLVIALNFLLGGGAIKFFEKPVKNKFDIPVISEFIPSRWAYEALMVAQFSNNPYEKPVFEIDNTISRSNYYYEYLLPFIKTHLNSGVENMNNPDSLNWNLSIVRNGIKQMSTYPEVFQFEYLQRLNNQEFSLDIARETSDYLTYLELFFYNLHQDKLLHKEEVLSQYSDQKRMKENNYNKSVAELVLANHITDQLQLIDTVPVRLSDPVFQEPVSNYGRARFFTGTKKFNDQLIATYWFNVSIIWLFSFLIYIFLLFDVFKKFRMN
ncbi:MAG: ATP-binding cassette domain-containing protein [Bacteroidales bacterium]|nr:ATP-binding cassette domain-containing protein [Bacteroidales bacterium]